MLQQVPATVSVSDATHVKGEWERDHAHLVSDKGITEYHGGTLPEDRIAWLDTHMCNIAGEPEGTRNPPGWEVAGALSIRNICPAQPCLQRHR